MQQLFKCYMPQSHRHAAVFSFLKVTGFFLKRFVSPMFFSFIYKFGEKHLFLKSWIKWTIQCQL